MFRHIIIPQFRAFVKTESQTIFDKNGKFVQKTERWLIFFALLVYLPEILSVRGLEKYVRMWYNDR